MCTLFKSAVSRYRPDLDLDAVATGEHWYGSRALELGLADELLTSDELLRQLAEERDLYEIQLQDQAAAAETPDGQHRRTAREGRCGTLAAAIRVASAALSQRNRQR